jgi:hypothetical protein
MSTTHTTLLINKRLRPLVLLVLCLFWMPLAVRADEDSIRLQAFANIWHPTTWASNKQTTLLETKLKRQLSQWQGQITKLGADTRLMEHIFYKVQRQYLRQYNPSAMPADLLTHRQYNCVTAVGMYAYIYEQLGITYQVYEAPMHVYLKIQLDNGQWALLETTIPQGFVTNQETIADLEMLMRTNAGQIDASLGFSYKIDLQKLAALQLYNQAIVESQAQNYWQAIHYINQARELYDSVRMQILNFEIRESLSQLSLN